MFKFVVLLLLLAFVLADDDPVITRFLTQVNHDGSYAFDVAQSDGVEFKEAGVGGQYAQGAYQYYSPEGQNVRVVYTADETGFHPETDWLPTPPPIPEHILRAIEYIRAHPTAEELADREVRARQL